ncbi:MAG: glycosyltransferase [Syntrophorhabdales bacterium]
MRDPIDTLVAMFNKGRYVEGEVLAKDGECGNGGRAREAGRKDREDRAFSPRRVKNLIKQATGMIEIVSATRCDAGEFKKTPLAQSLGRLKHDARLRFHVTLSNAAGLPEIYNRRIQESDNDVLVFVHDDVWIDDYFLVDRVIDGLELFQVIGVAGNTRLIDSHVAWHLRKGEWDFPHLSGSVAHGTAPFGPVTRYGDSPRRCELLDGVLLAARPSVLREKGLSFDTRFSFHFYDLDFCRTVRQSGLSVGTWPIAITHNSGGAFGSPQWMQALTVYKAKWP